MAETLRLLLLTEDCKEAEMAICQLELAGYRCQWRRVATRDDYLRCLAAADFNFVIADDSTPDLDGLTAVRLLIERGLDTPIILLACDTNETYELRCIEAGASDYVLKNCLRRLPHAVGRVFCEREASKARKHAMKLLKLQASALEAAANAIVITDRHGAIIWINEAVTRLTGYTFEEALGKSPRLFKSHKQDRAFYADLWRTILAGRVWQGQIINRCKDGSLYVEEMTITPVLNEANQITNFIAIKQDVTERQHLEQALREAEKRYRGIFENAQEGIFQATPSGQFITANPALARILGYDSTDELLASVHDIEQQLYVDGEQRRTFIKQLEAQGAVERHVALMRQKNGRQVWIFENARAVRDRQGALLYYEGVIEDITERQRAETKVREQLTELERWRDLTLDREDRTLELKHEVNVLLNRLQEPIRYPSAEA